MMILATLVALTLSASDAPLAEGAVRPALQPVSQSTDFLGVADPAPRARSVYRLSPWVDGSVTGGAALGLLIPTLLQKQIVRPTCPCPASQVPGFERGVISYQAKWAAPVSDATLAVSLVLPLVMDAIDVGFTKELAEDVFVYAEVLAVNGALLNLAKYSVQRPRPFVYGTATVATLQAPDSYASFYSGHTSFVVAALTAASFTYTRRHGPAAWPWVVTALVGLSVAAERVASGNHFYTDVVAGAAAGVLCGYLIPELHVRAPILTALAIGPLPGGAQVSFGRTF